MYCGKWRNISKINHDPDLVFYLRSISTHRLTLYDVSNTLFVTALLFFDRLNFYGWKKVKQKGDVKEGKAENVYFHTFFQNFKKKSIVACLRVSICKRFKWKNTISMIERA